MVITETGQAAEATRQRCRSKAHQPCLLFAAGVLVVGAALATVLYVELAELTDETSISTNQQQQLTVQEDPYSIGCYADDSSSRVMPYVYMDDEMTPSVSGWP